MYRNILKIITVFFVMLALIVPVTLEKLPAINAVSYTHLDVYKRQD